MSAFTSVRNASTSRCESVGWPRKRLTSSAAASHASPFSSSSTAQIPSLQATSMMRLMSFRPEQLAS